MANNYLMSPLSAQGRFGMPALSKSVIPAHAGIQQRNSLASYIDLVIPAQAGIQTHPANANRFSTALDARFHGHDGQRGSAQRLNTAKTVAASISLNHTVIPAHAGIQTHPANANRSSSALDARFHGHDEHTAINVAEYALSDVHKPMGIASYELTHTLPEALRNQLPSIERLEQELGLDDSADEKGAGV